MGSPFNPSLPNMHILLGLHTQRTPDQTLTVSGTLDQTPPLDLLDDIIAQGDADLALTPHIIVQ